MRRDGDTIMASAAAMFKNGSGELFLQGYQ